MRSPAMTLRACRHVVRGYDVAHAQTLGGEPWRKPRWRGRGVRAAVGVPSVSEPSSLERTVTDALCARWPGIGTSGAITTTKVGGRSSPGRHLSSPSWRPGRSTSAWIPADPGATVELVSVAGRRTVGKRAGHQSPREGSSRDFGLLD